MLSNPEMQMLVRPPGAISIFRNHFIRARSINDSSVGCAVIREISGRPSKRGGTDDRRNHATRRPHETQCLEPLHCRRPDRRALDSVRSGDRQCKGSRHSISWGLLRYDSRSGSDSTAEAMVCLPGHRVTDPSSLLVFINHPAL